MKQVKITDTAWKMLTELSNRKDNLGVLTHLEEVIMNAYKNKFKK